MALIVPNERQELCGPARSLHATHERSVLSTSCIHRNDPLSRYQLIEAPEILSLESVLHRVIKKIDNGSAPGVSGWNGSHLRDSKPRARLCS
jgi:hypothetical protein